MKLSIPLGIHPELFIRCEACCRLVPLRIPLIVDMRSAGTVLLRVARAEACAGAPAGALRHAGGCLDIIDSDLRVLAA